MSTREYYLKNKERIQKQHREYYHKNKEGIYEKRKEYYLKYYEKIKERVRIYSQKKYSGRRKRIIDALGGKCIRCGFTDIRALQIDHVNGHGGRERKSTINFSHDRYERMIMENKDRYQILCANCNWIKRVEKGEYKKYD